MRAYRPTDLKRCVKLFVKVFSQEPWEDRWPSLERAEGYLSDIAGAPGFRAYIAYEGRKLLGLCFGRVVRWWAGDEYFVDELCVDNDVQRKGIGTQMVQYVKQQCAKEGIQFIVLLTEKNTLAERFYAKQGFKTSLETVFMYHRVDGGT